MAELDHLDVPWTKQVVDVALSHLTRVNGLLNLLLGVVLRRPVELDIRARLDGSDRVVNRTTVTHDVTVEAPVFPQGILEQFRAVTGIGAVDIWERAHHRGRVSILDGHLEGQHVQLVHGLRGNLNTHRPPLGFLLVACQVLELGLDPRLGLDALDLLGRQGTRQVRVLTEVLIVPATVRVTHKVHARSEHHVMREGPCLLAEDSTGLIVQLAVEGRGHSHGGRQASRHRVIATRSALHTRTTVGHADCGDTQFLDSTDLPAGVLPLTPGQGTLGREYAALVLVATSPVDDNRLTFVVLIEARDGDLLDLLFQSSSYREAAWCAPQQRAWCSSRGWSLPFHRSPH